MADIDKILSDIEALKSTEKVALIEKVLESIYPLNPGVEKVWNEEAEERIIAYEQGHVPMIDELNVLKKYGK